MANLTQLQILPLGQSDCFVATETSFPRSKSRGPRPFFNRGQPWVADVQIWALSLCPDFRAEVETRKRSDGRDQDKAGSKPVYIFSGFDGFD